ncbi:hypothetical protein OPQ81_005127 [Rhizoctonia solani]|nr:hypothetical protein OPQ81_005127 [Rhizoctonia solani]
MLQNFTLDDASPLIQYDASWVDGYNSTADDQMPRYQGRSFHCTNTDGATANITFEGTAIYLYGAKRNNHGYYHIAVDDEPNVPMSGRPAAGAAEEFQTLLFSRQGLASGSHTLKLKNVYEDKDHVYVDIDYVVITREVDAPNQAPSIIVTHDDFKYSSLWSRQTDMQYYRNSTTHMTNTPGETATLNFRGPEISLYGGVGPAFGTFRVQVDSREPVVLNATTGFNHPPLTLFTTSGLGDGYHTLSITNLEGGKTLTIDYAEYIRTSSPGGSNTGLIGGVVGGVIGALAVLAVLAWNFIRRRKRARHQSLDERLPPTWTNLQWDNQIPITPYVDEHSQPPLGYVDLRSARPSTHTPPVSTTRKTEISTTTLPTLRSEQSTDDTISQLGLSTLRSPTEMTQIHEIDAETLPPMYHQVFTRQQPPSNVNVPTQI